jgi:23S rRNA (uracil1939-C5)-methyltransferase
LPEAEALLRKRERVRAALARFPSLQAAELGECLPAPAPFGYRTRVKLAVEPEAGRPARIGLFRPGGHVVVDIPACPVAHPGLLPVLEALRELVPPSGAPVRHLDARWSRHQGRAHVSLVAEAGAAREPFLALARALMQRCPEVSGVGLRTAKGPIARPVAGRTEPLLGQPGLVERLAGRLFHLSPGAFFQVDPAAAELLQACVRAWLLAPELPRARHLVDLFAGAGAFAICLADGAERVTAVESVETAAQDARQSARLSGLELRVVRGLAERFADELGQLAPDRVVLDPPRRGVEPGVLRALGLAGPERVCYVACDPETAARDADILALFDLATRRVQPIDLFAHTAEVECVLMLARVPGSFRPALLAQGPDWVVALKPALLATHPQARGEPNLRDALRRATGVLDLQPVHRLDVGTSGPVLFARGRALGALGRAFQAGEVSKAYLALVRGVPHKRGRVLGGPEAPDEETRFEREDVVGGYGLLRVFPRTGQRHQIRRHLRKIGHPILGDTRYGEPRANRFLAETCALQRPFLHLARLGFTPPAGPRVELDCPLAPELELVLERLRRLRAGEAPPDEAP